MQYYTLTSNEVLAKLETNTTGLSSEEVALRLKLYGRNVLQEKKKISPFVIFLIQFKSPLIIILIIATAISMLVGKIVDGLVVLIIVVLNAVFGFVQEYNAEKSMESLKKMMSLRSKVLRDGSQILVDSSDIVPGDVIYIEEGDKIPADGYLLTLNNLETAEAVLTGESLPIKKNLSVTIHDVPLGDQKNMVFSGTTVTQGNGTYVVTTTGMQTQIGSIATMIDNIKPKTTHLQKKLEKLSKVIGIVVIVICIVIFLTYYFINGLDLTSAFLSSVALAVAAIPEGLPAVVTISLGLGVSRMVKKNALMRKLPSVETLGSVNTICSDKTGTLTKNEMTVTQVYVDEKIIPVSGSGYSTHGIFETTTPSLEILLKIGLLCNHAHLHENTVIGDPTEGCLIVSAIKGGLDRDILEKSYIYKDERPFDSGRKMMSMVYDHDDTVSIMVKGAPEMLLDQCTQILDKGIVRTITLQDKKNIINHTLGFAEKAMRVLGFAYKQIELFDEYEKENMESELIFVGLQGIIDPPRLEVKDAITICHTAGINVVMITGDNIQTAKAIATQLGITGDAMEGVELTRLSDEELLQIIDRYGIFARVNPEHKQRLVKLLQQKGHVVAMTGDGVNDAPALKQADIGIAMGITGTDVSKEASDIILLDDNFTTILGAIEEGRGIYDNIKKFVNFLLSTNFGEVLIIFFTSLMGMPIPLVAIQVLWVNLVTDGLPAIALGIDPIDKDIMKRKPLNANNIIDKTMMINIVAISLLMTISVVWFYVRWYHIDLVMARSGVLVLLVLLEMMRVQMIRSDYVIGIFSNKWLIAAFISSILLILLVIYTPLHIFFETTPLSSTMWIDLSIFFVVTTIVGIGISYFINHLGFKKVSQ